LAALRHDRCRLRRIGRVLQASGDKKGPREREPFE
jgi:hypothetical protein